MKVAIVSIVNVKHMTLISLFTDILKKRNIDYDLIYIDKYGINETVDAKNSFKMRLDIKSNDNKLKKIIKYSRFRKYIKKVLRNEEYDLLIIWKSETAYLIFDLLLTKYKDKFVYSIRDYAKDNYFPINIIQNKLTKRSSMNIISSPKFLEFLPPNSNYYFVNSINPKLLNELVPKSSPKKIDRPLNICFIGYVRFIENDKKLMMELKNDKRFKLQYFGAGAEQLRLFAEKNEILNTEFIDSFDATETSKFLQSADIINNLYGNQNTALDTAISIKFYYSILLQIPILVWKGTYMEEITHDLRNSFIFDGEYSNLGDRLFEWYTSINWQDLQANSKRYLSETIRLNKKFEIEFERLVNNEE